MARAHPRKQRLCGDGDGAVRAHPAGVRTGVAFAESLVILGRRQNDHALAVRQCQHRQLLAVEKLFDQDLLAGIAH